MSTQEQVKASIAQLEHLKKVADETLDKLGEELTAIQERHDELDSSFIEGWEDLELTIEDTIAELREMLDE